MQILTVKNKQVIYVFFVILTIIGTNFMSFADVTAVSERTSEVRDAIVAAVPGVDTAGDVTEAHLAAITSLNLRGKGITALKSGDFSGLTGLTNLSLYNNELSSLPDGIFEGLTALTTLRLGSNTVDPMVISVLLEKVGGSESGGQFKAVVPTGAPFAIVLPVSVVNGSIADSATTITIARGSVESDALTLTRTAGTTASVTANIGTLPGLPKNHYGYTFTKSDTLPIEVLGEETITTTVDPVEPPMVTPPVEPPVVQEAIAPVFTDGSVAARTVAENTDTDVNIGVAVGATDANNDTLSYTLSGIDASLFSIDNSTGQLKTQAALDYETKRFYTVTITVSDGTLTDSITVIIVVIDVNDTDLVSASLPVSDRTPQVRDAIVAAIPGITDATAVTDVHLAAISRLDLRSDGITELKSGDFGGLSGLTSLNLYGNMLSSLPNGLFKGLTSLTSLRLGGNVVAPLPIIVLLQQVGVDQYQAVIPVGAPFDVVVQFGGIGNKTIPKGNVISETFTSTIIPTIGDLPALPANHFGYVLSRSTVCNRTLQVTEAITDAVPGVTDCRNVSDWQLTLITNLDLSSRGISTLRSDDFAGMLSLTTLNLSNNQLSSLPDGIFDNLHSLTTVDLSGNSVSPLPLTVSLEKFGTNMLKTVVSTGALFDISVPIIIRTGTILTNTITLTIPQGSRESQIHEVTRTAGTTAAVTANIGVLPILPTTHTGYALVKSDGLPVEVFSSINSAPIFTEGATATRSIAENTESGTNIGAAIAATDVDDDTLTYMLGGTDASSFSLVSTSGQLQTKDVLNYETKTTYSVTVDVSDGNGGSDSISVTINVTGVDENRAPVFTDGDSTTRSVAENTSSGENIGAAIGATDADDDTLTYSLSGTDASSFSLDSSSGQLSTKSTLDYEKKQSYSVTITVSDGTLTDTISVTVNVIDEDEKPSTDGAVTTREPENNAPEFTDGDSVTRSIAENTGAGVDIGDAVSATDKDKDKDMLTYSLGGTDASSFSIDSTTGQLRTSGALDFETKSSYSVIVTVSDGNTGSDAISVTINVTDIDENPDNNAPVFTAGESTTLSVAENTGSGADIGSAVSATDTDNDTLTYGLSGADASSFSIDSTTGQLRTSGALDYETKSSYSVIVTVSDGNTGSDAISVTINVTDIDENPDNNAPVFTAGESTTLSVAENTGSGADIGSAVSATDSDKDTLTYSLSGTDASSFSIDSTTGQLRTNGALDYETKSSYSVIVTVSDGNTGSDAISVTINVTDVDENPDNNAPVFTAGESTTLSVAENTGSGADIGSAVSATDSDKDTLTYSLSGADASSFSIDSTTGQLRTSGALDYETKSSYSVAITVSDGNGGSDSISVTINVTNVDESPTNNAPEFTDGSSLTLTVAENTGSDVNIGSAITATDADDDTLTYSLSGTDASSFSIDSSSGQVKTSAPLNYESKSSYSVVVNASDGNGGTDKISVTIKVTDVNEAPIFLDGTTTTRAIAENVPADINIGKAVFATDPDGDKLTYTLSGTNAASFSIDSATGQLKTKATLDYEMKASYSVTISVSDGEETDSITVTINITNLDETPSNNPPVFTDGDSTSRSVAENTAVDSNIGTAITATDADKNTLAYLLSGTDTASFSIDSATGQLKTSAALNHEAKSSYTVTVTVSDGSGTDSITVTISVTDVNEAPIIAANTETSLSIAENTAAGVNIGGTVSATDPDDGATLTYTLGGTDAASFDIVGTSGQLQTKTALDYETKESYLVTITVSDGTLTDEIDITINVSDIDENSAPVFTDGETTSREVAENTGSGVNIGSAVGATDADDDDLTYTLGGTDATSFSINSTNGQLRTSGALDYESKKSYSVEITVSDGKRTDEITVTINVSDVDENRAPVFTDGETTSREVAENTGSGVNIGSAVGATDADDDDLTYTLGGTDATSFSINSTNGQLRTSGALDYESKKSYSVEITVSDGKLTDEIAVTINVSDVDENRAPVFTDGETTSREVAENTGSGVNIGSAVGATDADDDDLTYTLGGTDATSFSINSTNGQLRTSGALDYESKKSYSVEITVSDGKRTDEITVTINVSDVDENRAPVFTDGETTSREVAENTGSGVNIGSAVGATDADDDDLTYTLGGTDATSFSINSTNGQLRTSGALDYESKKSYSVEITVSDGKLTDEIAVTINVSDVDENRAPVFTDGETTSREVAENTGSGVNIGDAVSATDVDDDDLTYTLGGTDASSFSIVSTSGQLQTKAALDYEVKNSYSVTITVADGNGKSDTIDVTIKVTDVAENSIPVFTDGDSTTREVAENTGSGQNIGLVVSATDSDSSDTLTYTLGGTDVDSFSIVSTSGQLQTKAALDYEAKKSYSVTITVSDGNGGEDNISVTINITDLNENLPMFTEGDTATRSIEENTAPSTEIGDPVSATDADSSDTLTYSLGGTDAASFTLVTTSGQLKTKAPLNYEQKDTYSVTVSVSDNKGGSDSIAVTINITNVAIEPPQQLMNTNVLSGRTSQVQDAIVENIDGVDAAANVTAAHLAAITSLSFSSQGITSLSANDFDGLTGLTNLSIWDNGSMTSLPDGLFDGLTALEQLRINDSNVTSIPDNIFDELSALTDLDLQHNALTSLSDGTFNGLSSLQELVVGENSISSLSADVFEGLASIEFIRLADNDLSSLPSDVFDGLSSLKTLNIGGNLLTDASEFEDLTSIDDLYLYGNPILDYGPLRTLKKNNTDIDIDLNIDNNPPIFTEGASTTRSVAENAEVGTKIGNPLSATDADGNTLMYFNVYSGDSSTNYLGDAEPFGLDKYSGQLRTKEALDFETKSSYTFSIFVRDILDIHYGAPRSHSGSDFITVTINVTDVAGAAPSVQPPSAAPDDTVLFSNYPNPFNPETWIPYQLANPSEVSITIYDIRGNVVRQLGLGRQPAGFYTNRSRAAHWDGQNAYGERVANGIYFYQLQADKMSILRKMVIVK